MIKDWAKRVGRVFVGYLAATMTASVSHVAVLSVFSVVAELKRGVPAIEIFDATISLAGGVLFFGTIFIFLMAMPVFVIVAFLAEWRAIRSRRYYLIAGSVAGLPAPLFRIIGDPSDFLLLAAVMLSGLCGGWAYWKVSGSRAGTNADPVPA